MNKIKPSQREKGITLITLVIMIIILVILAVIGIRALTGKNNIIGTTETAAEDYNITSYKEQIMQQVRSIIIAHANLGEEIGITQIAEELNEETIWVKSATANTDMSVTNEDIIVKVTDGYVFQVYYSNIYGTVFIEYVGKDKGSEPPNIKARYEKSIASIVYEVTDSAGEIEKVEIIYRGEVKYLEERTGSGEKKYNISNIGTGWYILKATSSSGKLRYAWVKGNNISDRLTPPVIAIEPVSPNGEAGWHKTGVKVSMSTDSPSAKEIRYRAVTGIANEEGEGETGEGTKYESTFDFSKNGSTTIYAWTTDDKGYVSEEAKVSFKIDSVKPSITSPAKITSTKPQVNGWYVSGLEIEIEGEDEVSGINGYYYMIKGEDTDWNFKSKDEKMKIGENEREGITEIVVKTVDVAGNESDSININIPKDTVKPELSGEMRVMNQTGTSFTVNAYAVDPEPSSTVNGESIKYECYITEVGTSERKQVGQGTTNTNGIFNVTGLKVDTSYDVEVIAKDPAGNTASGNVRGTTKGDLFVPRIDINGSMRDGYYIGDVTITITDTAEAANSSAVKIKYYQNGVETIKDGTSYSYKITSDGEYTITAYMQDSKGNTSPVSNEVKFTRDTVVPNAPTVTPTTAANNNGWYKANVTVNITAGSDATSGANKLKYSTNGGTSYTTTSAGVTTASVTVSSEGTTNIIAYTIDKAGHESTSRGSVTVKLDKTAPSISSITSTGTSETAASMTVNATDTGGSGIDQYKFYIGMNTTPKTTSTTKTASVTGLTMGANNTINVIVTDKAGNESTKMSKTVATKLYSWAKYNYRTVTLYNTSCESYNTGWYRINAKTTFSSRNACIYVYNSDSYYFSNNPLGVWIGASFTACVCKNPESCKQYYSKDLENTVIKSYNCHYRLTGNYYAGDWMTTVGNVQICLQYNYYLYVDGPLKSGNVYTDKVGNITSYCYNQYPTNGVCSSYYYVRN